jgi:crotonobetainyl-CoA:carnitine CoA-transferase CaiB-like acyl-CoA transferase
VSHYRRDLPPVKVGAPVTDITAGILGALGVLAAEIERVIAAEAVAAR